MLPIKIISILSIVVIFQSKLLSYQSIPVSDMQNAFNLRFCQCDHQTCQQNIDYLKGLADINYFSFQSDWIQKNNRELVGMTKQVYQTQSRISIGPGSYKLTSKNTVYMPEYQNGSISIRGLVVYNHATVLGVLSIPSNKIQQFDSLAALYLGFGFGLVLGDYIGFEDAQSFPQPYLLYPSASVCPLIKFLSFEFENQYSFIKNSNKLFLTGYSQGASLAFWINRQVQSNLLKCQTLLPKYSIVKISGLEGAYDSALVLRFLTEDVDQSSIYRIYSQLETNLAKPAIALLTIQSFYVYQGLGQLKNAVSQDYFQMICESPLTDVCKINGKKVTLKQALISDESSLLIGLAISSSSLGKSYQLGYSYVNFAGRYSSNHNSIYRLMPKRIIDSEWLARVISASNIVSYYTNVPSMIFTLRYDSVVSPLNSLQFRKDYKFIQFLNENFKVCVDRIQVKLDHLNAEYLANIFAVSWFTS